MKLTFSADITAADSTAKILAGQIVPFGVPGQTSIGPVIFEQGAFLGLDNGIPLNLEHDYTKPLGRMIDYTVTPGGINAVFKVVDTTAGRDVIVEAQEGVRRGFSIEASADKYEIRDGVMYVSAAEMTGVAVVVRPAFGLANASITDVAASEPDEAQTENTPEEIGETEVSETTTEVVEAAAPVVEAAAPAPVYASPRSPIVNASTYVEHSIKAAMGDRDSAVYVQAANDTTGNAPLVYPQMMSEIISSSNGNRAAIDAISTGALPDSGLSFKIPTVTTYPSINEVAEGGAIADSALETDDIDVSIKKFAGRAVVTWELIDRSTPAFFNALVEEMGRAYAKETDEYVLAGLIAGGTAGAAKAATAAGLQDFLADESSAVYVNTSDFADNIIANAAWWSEIKKFRDADGRPLYVAANPSNNPGAVGNTLRGDVLGFNLYVDPRFAVNTTADDSMLLVNSNAATWYESARTQLQVQVLGTGKVEVAVYGYGALAVKKPAGIRRWNVV